MIRSRSLRIFAVVLIAATLTVAAFGAGLQVGALSAQRPPISASLTSPRATNSPVPAAVSPENEPLLDMSLISEAWGLLKEQFYGELPQGKALTYSVLRGLLAQLGDQHTVFLEPKHAALANADIEGHFEGIGARVEAVEGVGILLSYIFPGQPAANAGLQTGDLVLAVDNTDVTHMTSTEAVMLIRGPSGKPVSLKIRRDNGEPFDVAITRARIDVPSVERKSLADGKVQYLALRDFSSTAATQVADGLKQAMTTEPDGIILDLRGNPGGLLEAAIKIGSLLVPDGDIVLERFKNGTERSYERRGRFMLGDTQLIVLVDGGSASASEIVGGAVQDAGAGVLLGTKTYGKGSVQQPNGLSDGSQIRITIAHWFTPKGRAIDGVGLTPDIEVSVSKEDVQSKRDLQLERAVSLLSTSEGRAELSSLKARAAGN
jgi:carboxyl-terminal processing protease